jgi:hypothetical protein
MVSDCLGMWDPYEGDMALRQVESKNVQWMTVDQVTERFSQAARLQASRAARAAARAQARPASAPTNMSMKAARGRAFRL